MRMPNVTPPVLQLHPSRSCNLRCPHCCSSSAPGEWQEQDESLLARAIADAVNLGYQVVSISGGEPLLYSGLPSLLQETRRHGMRTTITTNGLLLDERRIELLIGKVDLLAISLDGAPDRHNSMRNASRAFQTMRSRLCSLRSSGIPFGFLFTLTHENIDDLPWVAEFAAAEQTKLLQIHPLEEAGRARSTLQGQTPTDVDAAITWLLVQRLSDEYGNRLRIHLDFLNRDALRDFCQSGRISGSVDCSKSSSLADFISPLVVEADGTVVPLQYGFPRAYALGNLNDVPIMEMARRWFSQARLDWEGLWDRTSRLLFQTAELPFVNLHESVFAAARESHSTPFAILNS
jgi:MoaA/NifB/PqqE/SkfB family radical SAM enzyme